MNMVVMGVKLTEAELLVQTTPLITADNQALVVRPRLTNHPLFLSYIYHAFSH